MTYGNYEESKENGGPITLYRFTVGPGAADRICYTDADERVSWDGDWYDTIAISRDEIQVDGNLNKTSVKVYMARNLALVALFKFYPPSFVCTLEVFEGHFEDRDREFKRLWKGRVLNCDIADAQATFTCDPASTSLRRPGLRRNYQRQCPLVLYGTQCRATRTVVVVTKTTVTGNVITATPPGGFLAEAYVGGTIEWVRADNGRREIRSVINCAITSGVLAFLIAGPVTTLPATFEAYRGCAHTERTCNEWHANINNYGGQIWIPLDSPLKKISEYY